jgi:hypothetical protein
MAAALRAAEGRARTGLADLVPIVTRLLGWQSEPAVSSSNQMPG